MKYINLALFLLTTLALTCCASHNIASKTYKIPQEIRHTLIRKDSSELVYYLAPPERTDGSYPIAVICEGSSSKGSLESVMFMHDYFAKKLSDLGMGILLVEKQGINGNQIDEKVFFENYTRTQRLEDHAQVLDYIIKNSPQNWNGKFALIGASEGGLLVSRLAADFSNQIAATVNWSGAGDFSWRDELWNWISYTQKNGSPMEKEFLTIEGPKNREDYDSLMDNTAKEPAPDKWFMGMTYRYHADAMQFKNMDYQKIKAPMLVVCGTDDPLIPSCDKFIENAKVKNAPITFWRFEGLKHRVSQDKKFGVIPKSLTWLKSQLDKSGA